MNKLLCIAVLAVLVPLASEAAPLKARRVAAGAVHACAILKDGRLKCWGHNEHGQLGLGDQEARGDEVDEMGNHLPFVDLGADETIRQVALGSDHTCALFGANGLKCWGSNAYGQLGLGDLEDRGDEAGEMGGALPLVMITPDRTIVSVVAGGEHTCVLLDDGIVKCWGRNHHGQLGLGHAVDFGGGWLEYPSFVDVDLGPGRTAVQIAAGDSHNCALLDDDTIKCWGNNDSAQLGVGHYFNRGDHSLEMGLYLQEVEFGADLPVSVVAGEDHTCALLDSGDLKCWGSGRYGQLGQENEHTYGDAVRPVEFMRAMDLGTRFKPVASLSIGASHTCLIGGGEASCWGHNMGQLGVDVFGDVGDELHEMGAYMEPVMLHADVPVQLEGGNTFTCARLLNERIKCWGVNLFGELGLGDRENRGLHADDMGSALPYVDLGDDGKRAPPGGLPLPGW